VGLRQAGLRCRAALPFAAAAAAGALAAAGRQPPKPLCAAVGAAMLVLRLGASGHVEASRVAVAGSAYDAAAPFGGATAFTVLACAAESVGGDSTVAARVASLVALVHDVMGGREVAVVLAYLPPGVPVEALAAVRAAVAGLEVVLGEPTDAALGGSALAAYGAQKQVANRESRVWLARRDRKGSLNDGRIQNPSNTFGIVPLSNFVPRGFGFVHHSIAIIDHEVPNPNLTIRALFHRSAAAAEQPGRKAGGKGAAVAVVAVAVVDALPFAVGMTLTHRDADEEQRAAVVVVPLFDRWAPMDATVEKRVLTADEHGDVLVTVVQRRPGGGNIG
jgi:hypothetical protein